MNLRALPRIDRLDRVALGVMAGLTLLIAALLAWGDGIGLTLLRSQPPTGARNVPVRGRLQFTFSEPVVSSTLKTFFSATPPLSASVRWAGATAFLDIGQGAGSPALAADTAYTLTLRAGLRGVHGRVLLRDIDIPFRTGHARLAYMAPASGVADIYLADIAQPGMPPQRLTAEAYGVMDFAVSPDGQYIVYSARRDEGLQQDLWMISSDGGAREKLLDCPNAVCKTASWSGDGARIAFEKRSIDKGSLGLQEGPSRVWLLDVNTRESAPLLADNQLLGNLPRWSPVGDELAYYNPTENVIVVYNTATGERQTLPSLLGDSGFWAPDGKSLIFPELQSVGEQQPSTQLFRADFATGVVTPTMPLTVTDDGPLAFAPSDDGFIFSRRIRGAALGAQIYRHAGPGTGVQPITNDPKMNYGGLAWSPDAAWVAAVRYELAKPNATPSVWLAHPDGTEERIVAEDATLPQWLP